MPRRNLPSTAGRSTASWKTPRPSPRCSHLPIVGLMTMAAYDDEPESARPTFVRLRQARDQLRQRTGLALPELSMGMSNDFEVAIEEGATWIRVGSALFEGLAIMIDVQPHGQGAISARPRPAQRQARRAARRTRRSASSRRRRPPRSRPGQRGHHRRPGRRPRPETQSDRASHRRILPPETVPDPRPLRHRTPGTASSPPSRLE